MSGNFGEYGNRPVGAVAAEAVNQVPGPIQGMSGGYGNYGGYANVPVAAMAVNTESVPMQGMSGGYGNYGGYANVPVAANHFANMPAGSYYGNYYGQGEHVSENHHDSNQFQTIHY